MKRTIFLLLAATVLACGCSHEKQAVRLVYWNIQNGMWDGQNDNYDRFVNWVSEKDPDICVWAEAQSIFYTDTDKGMKEEERYLVKHWDELAARYGHKYVYIGGYRDSYPQAITSKYPIENVDRIIGNDADSVVLHGCGWATIDIKGKKVNIVTLHLAPHHWAPGLKAEDRPASAERHEGDKYRRKEIQYICEHTIATHPDAKDELWMMMGDFNSRSRADNAFYGYADDDAQLLVHDYIAANTPYLDALVEKHPGEFPVTMHYSARLDYLYLTPKMLEKAEDVRVCRDYYTEPVRDPQKLSNFWRPSDHRPIIADFKF
ncbi:MAG: endonuclease [Bacteroidales bacterium]|nr:endonuclease [Bacteroidales bacterium]